VIVPASIFLPGYYRQHRSWSLTAALEQHGSAFSDTAAPSAFAIFDPQWWVHTDVYDTAINRTWILASVLIVAWAMASAWRVSRVVRLSRRESKARLPKQIDGFAVLVTDAIGPASVGILSSEVLVPRWVLGLPVEQRQYVLRHEEEHRRAHDALLLFVASLPLILMPWNLALWWQLRRLCLAVEMDCDNRVVRALGDPHAYGHLLLRVAEVGGGSPRLQPAFLGAGMLERRLRRLLAPAPLKRLERIILPAMVIGLLVLVIWMPHPITGHHTHQPTQSPKTESLH
jgi:beta-lactamase regulating signal transducer with metallopeptidase domain